MIKVKVSMLEGLPWIVYKRKVNNVQSPDDGKEWSKPYWHCTCQGQGQHGAVDVRYDERYAWKNHSCIRTEKSQLILQLERLAKERKTYPNRTQSDVRSCPSSKVPLSLFHSWVRFQAVHDLAFTAPVSKEFFHLAHQLIKLGQTYPCTSAEVLFPPLSRRKFGNFVSDYSKRSAETSLEKFQGHFVSPF
jgi:hypothetical protein